jgi:hypothetical protein
MAREYKVIDNCPVPEVLYDELVAIKAMTGVTYNSIYRGTDAEGLLKRLGKMSQRQLWDGFRAGLPGFNPANPPGQSTHECYSDGVAYAVPRGVRLPAWCCGIDSSWSAGVTNAASKRGWTVTLTYPGNPREGHHVNFRKKPKLRVLPALKRNSRGPRAAKLARDLKYVGFYRGPVKGRVTALMVGALKDFQRHYHQNPDGIYGVQTARQLRVVMRAKKKCRRKAKQETKGKPIQRRERMHRCNRRYGPEGKA